MSRKILTVDKPDDYAAYVGAPSLHPFVNVIHYDELEPFRHSLNNYGVYGLFIQREFPKSLSYGMKTLQVSDASIIAVAPGQIGGSEDNGERITLSGWVVLWSPALLHGSDLEERMADYRFFSYFATEALRMTPGEWLLITQLTEQLRRELRENGDSPALRRVALAYLRLLLEYCHRIYQRQQSPHDTDTTDVLKRFNALLEQYYINERQLDEGLPTVTRCAAELAYSPHYFGDLVRKATGHTAIAHIHAYVINKGKSLLMSGYNINETSHLLGFEYPQHFTRLFKRLTGTTPSRFLSAR